MSSIKVKKRWIGTTSQGEKWKDSWLGGMCH